MKSKRFEVLAARPVNQDGYVQEWPEVGLIAMNSPFDPKPGIKIEHGVVTEMDGKCRADFDMLDTFIADHAIRLGNAEKAMAMDSLEIARKIVDINVSRKEILDITLSLTPAKLTEVVGKLNIVEIMMGMTKMRARMMPANQCHVTNVRDNPVQIAADAAEAGVRGFAEMETTVAVARYAPFNAMALFVGAQVGRPGVMTSALWRRPPSCSSACAASPPTLRPSPSTAPSPCSWTATTPPTLRRSWPAATPAAA